MAEKPISQRRMMAMFAHHVALLYLTKESNKAELSKRLGILIELHFRGDWFSLALHQAANKINRKAKYLALRVISSGMLTQTTQNSNSQQEKKGPTCFRECTRLYLYLESDLIPLIEQSIHVVTLDNVCSAR